MKKILLTTIFSVFYIASASADIGVNVGISGNAGVFTASAKERLAGTGNIDEGSEHGEAAWSSVFIEKTLGPVLFVGVDYVTEGLETDQAETAKVDKGPDAVTSTIVTNKIKVAFEDLTSYYIGARLGNAYVKAGTVTVDVITKESLGTGSKYGNTSLDGTLLGVGHNHTFDNGFFIRAEGNYMEFDGVSLSSTGHAGTANKITLKNLDGVSGKLSVGKSF